VVGNRQPVGARGLQSASRGYGVTAIPKKYVALRWFLDNAVPLVTWEPSILCPGPKQSIKSDSPSGQDNNMPPDSSPPAVLDTQSIPVFEGEKIYSERRERDMCLTERRELIMITPVRDQCRHPATIERRRRIQISHQVLGNSLGCICWGRSVHF
jgi:hypothetical protein